MSIQKHTLAQADNYLSNLPFSNKMQVTGAQHTTSLHMCHF